MVTLPSQNLQSARTPCVFSLNSPSQFSTLKFPIFSPIKLKPTKPCTSNNGSCNSQLEARSSASQSSADISDILSDVRFSQLRVSLSFSETFGAKTKESLLLLSYIILDAIVELKEAKARFDSVGTKLIAIVVGTPSKARMLAERLPFPMDCLYADPDRKADDVLGLYHGFDRTFFNLASTKVFSKFEASQKAVKNYTIEATLMTELVYCNRFA